ncbi:MAG: nucleotide exchange factor GrpE [Verrucomicrobiota bacterium]|jgi:molecular chaperone GrpE|nr:MAG: nucleotide exchange factor GrpE [Opitutales bacterium]
MTESSSNDGAAASAEFATRIAELEGEVARLKDTLLRSQADQQNQQRRHQREREDLRKFATANLVEELLPSLDALALGLEAAAGKAEGQAVAEGFRMAVNQLRSVMAAQGLAEINPLGQAFNPGRHESVGQESHLTIPEGSVSRVARVGWLLNDRVIRAAAVFVSTGFTK